MPTSCPEWVAVFEVPTIRRYLIVESTAAVTTALERAEAGQPWMASAFASGDVLRIPEVGIVRMPAR